MPLSLTAFRCVILIERAVDAAERAEVSRRLVKAGCLYAMAWGIDCSLWDDSIDEANIATFFPKSVPADQFVMTTWHSEETIDDVFFYAKHNALLSYDDLELVDLLVLDIGRFPREDEIREAYEQS